jgi:signal transduction histidine kinase/DNA-binding response OmpR family regulator/ligand-binding sensor domain-containing protein
VKFRLLFAFIVISTGVSYSAPVKFYNINTLHGISLRETTSVCQDKNGFIWAASKMGILRLTDDDYHIYQLPYQTANVIDVKLCYQDSILAAYTNNGQIFLYNAIKDSFEFLFDISKMLNIGYVGINNLLIDEQGVFWIASSMGLYKYFSGNLSCISNSTNVRHVWYDKNQFLLTKSDSICLIDSRTAKEKTLFKNMIVSASAISSLCYDKAMDRLWIGSRSNGLFYYDIKQSGFYKLNLKSFPKQPILDIETNTDSTLWVGFDGQGLWELNKTNNGVRNIYTEDADNPSSLQGDGVYDILYDDNSRRVWVCTNSGGVSFFDQALPLVNQITHKINNSNSLCNNNINKILEDIRGNIWFATNNGISRWDVSSDKWSTFYHNEQKQAKVFLAICEDNNGHIWAGSYSSGVYVLDKNSGKEIAHYFGESNISFVLDIFKDTQGNVWVGGNKGNVCCWVEKEKRFRSYKPNSIGAITELSPQKMLFSCAYGLELLDKQTEESQILISGYLGQDALIKGENVWWCTQGEGLIKYNITTHDIQKFTIDSGLPSNYVNSILYNSGYFWVGTERGLFLFNPDDNSIFTYLSQPVFSVSFNRGAHCELKNGQIILGTNKGALLFDPEAFCQLPMSGKIFFQDISLSGHSIRNNSSTELSVPLNSLHSLTMNYTQNTLTLEMIPIGSTVTDFKFSWKMDGLDTDWTKPSNQRILTYSNIPNGSFRLLIRLYDGSLSQIIAERELILHVMPPFWETWWFLLLLFVIVAGIIWFSLRFYINRLKQLHTEEKVRFFTNTAHDIRTSITLIKGPAEELIKESSLSELGHRYLQLITEQSRRLSAVVTQLMDFQKVDVGKGQLALTMVDVVKLVAHRTLMFESYAEQNKVELVFSPQEPAYLTAIDELKIEKVVDNLISNAVKYSHPDSRVDIILKCNPNNWVMEVTDTGIGINRQAQRKLFKEFFRSENAVNSKIIGSGVGLMLVKHYIVMHGGNISFVSKENAGSTFKVIVPLKEVADVKKPVDFSLTSEVFTSLPGSQFLSLSQQTDSRQHKMRLLIVEDNPDMQNFIGSALCREFQVLTADDGVHGWEAILKQQPDLVISDVMMPNMDGFELCRQMKSTYETSHIPIILLTARTAKAEQLYGLGLGADDYLTKPFDMTLLLQRIKSIIQNRKTVREKALKLINRNNDEPILMNDLNDKFVKKAMEVVRANMANENFSKDEFASAMNVSSSLLYRKIKSLTDQSPIDFIKSIRLNHALELLQSQKYTVTEVSEMCGFSYVEYFSLAFKKYFGKAPTKI